MNIEALIGVGYCAIGMVHLLVYLVRVVKDVNIPRDPMDPVIATFVWPLVDILWLLKPRGDRS